MDILVTGASGYIGGRLIPELLAAGHRVRAASRHPDGLARFDWYDDVDTVRADLSDPSSLTQSVDGIEVIYYLVHSMGDGTGTSFEDAESDAAMNLAEAAAAAGVSRIIYLSGMHPPNRDLEDLSRHMRSRERVARILLEGDVPAVVLRAATVIGSGSASFEIIRHLTERLPVMVAPQWINNRIEPISVRDVLHYLVHAAGADTLDGVNDQFDVGCGQTYRFSDLLRIYGRIRGLRRLITAVPVPLPMDQLSGGWIGLVTPVPRSLAVPLAQSMAEDAVTTDGHRIRDVLPDPPGGLADYPTAVRRALQREATGEVPTSWDRSWQSVDVGGELPTDPDWSGETVYTDSREARTTATVEQVWRVVESIGGHNGWYSTPLLWNVRGIMDRLVGGPGLGGRRDPRHLATGDRVDWWRVERIDRPTLLVLRAEMKVSGQAWLILRVDGDAATTVYRQDAVFLPRGLRGRAYWWGVAPFHAAVFPLMKRNIIAAAAAE
ncbi:SDR family oxidoreductase [Corynebacterium glyciniphilum]|uniref:SDR family oxidoreductase n=1 Tax=Corynebacterium glyciniphilum TaxID=1404244 RepID=UPI00264E4557|nr:SDR family oxidoreductase [Corynebacterium glyciniphilum]MDN6706224.1 SDR family oxidoreductase [Corynebacterium glyciniphilum]